MNWGKIASVAGTGERDPVEGSIATDSGVESGETDSVDSFLRDVAHAPGRTPRGSTLESGRSGVLAALAPGVVVAGRFRLERKLGEGGMGIVWQAVHAVTRKPVALKVLKRSGEDDARALQRFLREARAACAVRHPSVVQVHDVLELEDGSPVMVMELLSGETLAQRLTRERVLPLPDLARIMVHVCSAVGCAHALGIVHRDLKPENIFLAKSPAGAAVKVLDFGIAKLTSTDGDAARTGAITGTGTILGTPYYMAPEQLFGEKDIDHRADIWALGIIFYEALAGERPTRGENVGQIYKVIVTDTIVPLRERAAHLPAPIIDLVGRMLSRDRAKRPPDVHAILSVLAEYTSETFVVVTGPPPAQPPKAGAESEAADPPSADAPAQPNRSGIELPLPSPAQGRALGPVWVLLSLVAASALGIGGFVTWRARSTGTQPVFPANAALPEMASPSPVRPPDPQIATQPPTPAASPLAPSSNQDAAVGSTAATQRERRRIPRPAASPLKPGPSTAASTAAPAATMRSTPPAATYVDPGSYQ